MTQLQNKRVELEESKNTIRTKLSEECVELLEILLESQVEITRNNTPFATKQFERAKKSLGKKLTAEEIEKLLNEQRKVVELEIQLENLQVKSLDYQSQIQISPK